MPCARGCCASRAEHYRSLRVLDPQRRQLTNVTVDHTDETVNTVTQHWHDRQDVNVRVLKPLQTKAKGAVDE